MIHTFLDTYHKDNVFLRANACGDFHQQKRQHFGFLTINMSVLFNKENNKKAHRQLELIMKQA